jgi:uncharacterized protein YaaW (UPF0174 family)
MNITGNNNTVNTGDQSCIAQGDNNSQTIITNIKEDISKFIEDLETQLDKIFSDEQDKQDVRSEIEKIRNQLNRQLPKETFIKRSLECIRDLLIGVTSNVLARPIIQNLDKIIPYFC